MIISTTAANKEERTLPKSVKYMAVAAIWLVLWEALCMIINEEILFVSPLSVVIKLFEMVKTTEYWRIIFSSMTRVIGGFVLGYLLAALLAFISFKFEFFRMFMSPLISVVKATPVASFIILALMWTGKDFVPVVICILMVMPIVWSNVLEGLRSVDKNLIEMSTVYKFSAMQRIKYIYIPSLIPYNAAAAGSGLGLCWKAGIAAEVICRTLPSIGNSIWETKFYIETEEMFAWTATVVILSVVFDFAVKRISRRITAKVQVNQDD